jgi:hypothetical protein
MRQAFDSFFTPTKEFFNNLWKNGIIVLDANVILDFYRYSGKTRDDLIDTLRKLSDRLWIPHQAGLEFARNRPEVILTQKNMYSKVENVIEELCKNSIKTIDHDLQFRSHPAIEKSKLSGSVRNFFDDLKKNVRSLAQEHPDFFKEDPIVDMLFNIFHNKIGSPYSDEKLNEIYAKGKIRYEKNIPPGYADATGPNRKEGDAIYGDLVLWFQIIDKAKQVQKPIILISNDNKEDWWWIIKGKTFACRPELRDELKRDANCDFYMYTTDRFLKYAPEMIGVEFPEDSISEIQSLQAQDKQQRERQALISNVIEAMELQEQAEKLKSSDFERIMMRKIEGLQKVVDSARQSPDFERMMRKIEEWQKFADSARQSPDFERMMRKIEEWQKFVDSARQSPDFERMMRKIEEWQKSADSARQSPDFERMMRKIEEWQKFVDSASLGRSMGTYGSSDPEKSDDPDKLSSKKEDLVGEKDEATQPSEPGPATKGEKNNH